MDAAAAWQATYLDKCKQASSGTSQIHVVNNLNQSAVMACGVDYNHFEETEVWKHADYKDGPAKMVSFTLTTPRMQKMTLVADPALHVHKFAAALSNTYYAYVLYIPVDECWLPAAFCISQASARQSLETLLKVASYTSPFIGSRHHAKFTLNFHVTHVEDVLRSWDFDLQQWTISYETPLKLPSWSANTDVITIGQVADHMVEWHDSVLVEFAAHCKTHEAFPYHAPVRAKLAELPNLHVADVPSVDSLVRVVGESVGEGAQAQAQKAYDVYLGAFELSQSQSRKPTMVRAPSCTCGVLAENTPCAHMVAAANHKGAAFLCSWLDMVLPDWKRLSVAFGVLNN